MPKNYTLGTRSNMGGGGQPKNTTTTTETKIPDWLSNDYQQFIGQTNAQNAKPYQSYGGQLNADMSSLQQQAALRAQLGATDGAAQNNALYGILNGSQNVTAQTSPYSGQNQYLDGVVNDSNRDITNSYLQGAGVQLPTQFAQGGAFGGSAMQQASTASQQQLAQSLASNTDNLRYQDYNDQANRWQQGFQNQLAASQQNTQNMLGASQGISGVKALESQYNSQLAGLGQVQQDYAQGNINQAYNDWYQQNYGYGQQQLSNYGNALNAVSGQFQGSSTTGANPAYQPKTAGGALASAGAGAAAGSMFGPWGAVAGGVIGAGSYYL